MPGFCEVSKTNNFTTFSTWNMTKNLYNAIEKQNEIFEKFKKQTEPFEKFENKLKSSKGGNLK